MLQKAHSLKKNVFKVGKKLRATFNSEHINQVADSVNLVLRERNFNAMALLSVMVFGESKNYQVSLTEKCQHLFGIGISMSKQALDKRLNAKAAKFLKQILEDLLEINLLGNVVNPVLSTFAGINVIDATSFQLPDKLETHYKGFGGGATSSGVKTQYQIEITTGDTIGIEVVSATSSDTKTELIDPKKDTLQLFDLGYICFDLLKKIAHNEAYYLSRIKYGTRIWIRSEKATCESPVFDLLDWDKQIRKMRVGQIQELTVYIGSEKEIETRLIIEKVPPELAKQKRRKLKTDKVNKRKNLSKGRLAFCELNVFITNTCSVQVLKEDARMIYGLRWQIEIYFKTWKSYMNIDKIQNMNANRFNCTHYGTLIYIILTTKVFFYIKHQHWNRHKVELSELKAMKLLAAKKNTVWKILFDPTRSAYKALRDLSSNLQVNCIKESKKDRLTPYQTIDYALS